MAKQKNKNKNKKSDPKRSGTARAAVPENRAKTERKSAPSEASRAREPYRSMACKVFPYLLIVFALVLAICLVIVHLVGLDDGAGIIGYGIQWFFGGLFGGALILLPAVLAYIGIKWCMYNVKWKEYDMVPSSEFFSEYCRAKHRLVLQITMTALAFLTVSVMLGVLADYGDLDVQEMWESGAEELFEGGGVIGGMLGYGMSLAFRNVISMVILSILLVLFVLLMVGLTPDYFLSKIQDSRELRREKQACLAAQRREEEMRRREALKEKKAAVAAEAVRLSESSEEPDEPVVEAPKTRKKKCEEISCEELLKMGNDEPTPPEAEETALPEEDEADPIAEMTANLGKDYGVEPPAPEAPGEYDSLDQFFKSLEQKDSPTQTPSAPKREEPVKPLDLSELGMEDLLSDVAEVTPEQGEDEQAPEEPEHPYLFPPIDLMEKNPSQEKEDFTAELQENARLLLETLQSFRINIKSIDYSRGPTITRYELRPEAGVRVRSIANLVDDIALSLATSGVRIEAPIPGKPAVGIEVPNRKRATVYLRDLIENQQFTEAKSKLTAALGMDVGGNPIYFDIAKMPHMIIAGATGMGKSVCINSIIISILYKAKPEDVKLILIDPKKVEFNLYKDIPHLYAPVVSEPKKAAGALASAVAEMERRFELIEEVGVRDIASYNAATENDPYKEHMPHMVIIIDELADLMMTAPDDVEASICRLAQKARAAGIHIIIGTQRPSVDVITGLIKANIPSRIACTVSSQVDSRTIIDIAGAEKLIGRGDMLFAPVGSAKPLRVQGAFVTETEVENICTFIRDNNSKAKYNNDFMNRIEEEAAKCGSKKGSSDAMASAPESEGGDSKFCEAVKLAVEEGKISTSLMQRRLGVGYGRAAKIIDIMEQMGYVSKPDGNKPRRVLLSAEEYSQRLMDGTLGGESDD